MRFLLALSLLLISFSAHAAEPIKIGSLFAYSTAPEWGKNYDNGAMMAINEINETGGVLGREFLFVNRDSKLDVAEIVKVTDDLNYRENIDIYTGTLGANTSLALSEWAKHNKKFFLVTITCSDDLVWERGNDHTFKLHPQCSSLAKMLADEAAKIGATRWAYVGFIGDYPEEVLKHFRERLDTLQPDVEWVEEIRSPIFKFEPGPSINLLRKAKPEAVLNLLVVNYRLSVHEFIL